MTDKYKNKYRVASARLRNWNYGWVAPYFITICTNNREHYFGEIYQQRMQLSEIGQIVITEWIRTPDLRPDMNLELGSFVVMPNHFHAILIIGHNKYNRRDAMLASPTPTTALPTTALPPTASPTTESPMPNNNNNNFGPQRKNLGSVIRGFKSSVTKQACGIHADFLWQPRFHESIIRNLNFYKRVEDYIDGNVCNWQNDVFCERP